MYHRIMISYSLIHLLVTSQLSKPCNEVKRDSILIQRSYQILKLLCKITIHNLRNIFLHYRGQKYSCIRIGRVHFSVCIHPGVLIEQSWLNGPRESTVSCVRRLSRFFATKGERVTCISLIRGQRRGAIKSLARWSVLIHFGTQGACRQPVKSDWFFL